MHSGDVALRFSVVFAVAGFIIMAAGVYEIDRREKVVLKQLLLVSPRSSSESQSSVTKFVFSTMDIRGKSTPRSGSFTRSIFKFKHLSRVSMSSKTNCTFADRPKCLRSFSLPEDNNALRHNSSNEAIGQRLQTE